MAHLQLEHVTKRFGRLEAVKDLTLSIQDGEFFCILGPPGAGKTTTLRLIVGLEKPEEGQVYIDSEPVNDVYPGRRDIAMVFQNLALYPNKTVFENIAYPLRERKLPNDEITRQVNDVAKTLHIDRMLDRKPAKLSGGERQRVAIGRAIVRHPRAYLMDEPLANLDAKLRQEMRVELKRLQKELGQTLVYVTHDQIEALSMADRIAILHKGVLQQVDTPDNIYHLPANRFVATVVGSPPMNFLPCRVSQQNGYLNLSHQKFGFRAAGEQHPLRHNLSRHGLLPETVLLGIRPEDIAIFDQKPSDSAVAGQVLVVEPLGSETILDIELGSDLVKAVIPPTQKISEEQVVWFEFNPAKLHVLDNKSGTRLYSSSKEQPLPAI
ncbi:MAG: Trehalose import ATP-binding protein SugC [Anaerolineae bacterium]|nr:Trehalose import ATP-binding protein SugC [Anaerolineae bacterium]